MIKKEILYLVTKQRIKNGSIQLWSDNELLIKKLQNIFYKVDGSKNFNNTSIYHVNLYKKYTDLNLFLQGCQNDWIMLESWDDKEDLMIEFAELCAKELNLEFDII